MPVYHFRLTPLSPVHVGAGEPLAAEDYFLSNGKLTRFLPAAVVRAMTDAERSRYLGLLSGPPQQLDEALKLLRQRAMQTPKAWIYSVEVGPESRQALSQVIEKLDTRSGDVRPLLWNLATGRAVLPGSAIKGAIRTGLLSALVAHRLKSEGFQQGWERRLPRIQSYSENVAREAREVARLAQDLEREILRRGGDIESDPFRFLKVADAEIPAECIRVDRAALLAPSSRADAQKIQMHFERIRSALDNGAVPAVDIFLTIERQEKDWHPAMKPYLQSFMNLDYLRSVLNWHYRNRLNAERQAFRNLWYDPIAAAAQELDAQGSNAILLRIGRFSHFESLSVEGLRRTLNRRSQWVAQGTSRTYCTIGGKPAPFGWVKLTLVRQVQ